MSTVSLEVYEREHWLNGKLPATSSHLSHAEFIRLRAAERYQRALDAQKANKLCVVCQGPVFAGSFLGLPITVWQEGLKADFHIHEACAQNTPMVVIQQAVEHWRLLEGRVQ
jgi:hypothetical protein